MPDSNPGLLPPQSGALPMSHHISKFAIVVGANFSVFLEHTNFVTEDLSIFYSVSYQAFLILVRHFIWWDLQILNCTRYIFCKLWEIAILQWWQEQILQFLWGGYQYCDCGSGWPQWPTVRQTFSFQSIYTRIQTQSGHIFCSIQLPNLIPREKEHWCACVPPSGYFQHNTAKIFQLHCF